LSEVLKKIFDASVGMNLARRFYRGPRAGSPRGVVAPGSGDEGSRRVAKIESDGVSGVATRRGLSCRLFPTLKGRAKFMPTLRVERVLNSEQANLELARSHRTKQLRNCQTRNLFENEK
jgi:hypothetical protein